MFDYSGTWTALHGGDADVAVHAQTAGRRVAIVLLDSSFSMAFPADEGHAAARPPRRRIDLLNDQLREWLPKVRDAGTSQLRDVEMAVITFGGRGVRAATGDDPGPVERWHEDDRVFVPAAALRLNDLEASGTTHMVAAVSVALELAEARVRYLAARGIRAEQVRILMFGDGGSYDRDLPADAWRSLAVRLAELRQQHRVRFFAFGAPGADESVLRAMAGDDGYVPLAEFDFERLLDLIFRATSAALDLGGCIGMRVTSPDTQVPSLRDVAV